MNKQISSTEVISPDRKGVVTGLRVGDSGSEGKGKREWRGDRSQRWGRLIRGMSSLKGRFGGTPAKPPLTHFARVRRPASHVQVGENGRL